MTKNNKKLSYTLLAFFLVVSIILLRGSISTEGKDDSMKIYLDDKIIKFNNQQPINKNGAVYVSTEEYCKKIGVKVDINFWNNKITMTKDNRSLFINTKTNTAITNEGKTFFIHTIGKSKNKLIPIDIISDFFGYTVKVEKSCIKINKVTEEKVIDDKIPEENADEQGKVAYLTFDDGPNGNTSEILNILKQKNVKATFFMLGSSIISHKEEAKRISEEGHALGVHSLTHNFKTVYASPESFLHEMNSANNLLFETTGKKTFLMRAPYGSKPYMKQEYRDLVTSWGYRIWDWNVDSRDSINKYTTPDEVYNNVVNQVAGKEKVVILFHDREHTVKALGNIIDYLQSNGYKVNKINDKMTPMNFWGDIR